MLGHCHSPKERGQKGGLFSEWMNKPIKRGGESFVGSGCVERELVVRGQKLKTSREEKKLEFIWIHIKITDTYGNHKSRLQSSLEMLAASRGKLRRQGSKRVNC